MGLLGPNGAGKTTLFKILSTLLPHQEGEATIFGVSLRSEPDKVRRNIGVVFQSPSLDGKLTVIENLKHQGHLYGLRGKPLASRTEQMLKRVGLYDRLNERVDRLSGGLARRVELAKGLLHWPQLLLLDEPSTGLDPGARRDLWLYLEQLRQNDGVTILITTHLMEEAERCDRVAILSDGKIVALESPNQLKSEIGGEVITLSGKNLNVLMEKIAVKLSHEQIMPPQLFNGFVRIECRDAKRLLPKIMENFQEEVTSLHISKPTLEDVFIHKTGHRFWDEEPLEEKK